MIKKIKKLIGITNVTENVKSVEEFQKRFINNLLNDCDYYILDFDYCDYTNKYKISYLIYDSYTKSIRYSNLEIKKLKKDISYYIFKKELISKLIIFSLEIITLIIIIKFLNV